MSQGRGVLSRRMRSSAAKAAGGTTRSPCLQRVEVPITDCPATEKPAIRRSCSGGVSRGPLVPVALAPFHLALLPALSRAGRCSPASPLGGDTAPLRIDAGPAQTVAPRRLAVGRHTPWPARRRETWGPVC